MLDKDGYVAETNATNLFLVKHNILYTPTADVCLPGVTRQSVIEIARKLNITVVEKLLSLVDFYTAGALILFFLTLHLLYTFITVNS